MFNKSFKNYINFVEGFMVDMNSFLSLADVAKILTLYCRDFLGQGVPNHFDIR